MPVKFWQTSTRFWFFLSHLITTVSSYKLILALVVLESFFSFQGKNGTENHKDYVMFILWVEWFDVSRDKEFHMSIEAQLRTIQGEKYGNLDFYQKGGSLSDDEKMQWGNWATMGPNWL